MSRYCPAIRRDCLYLKPILEEFVEMLGAAKNSGRLAGLKEAREAVADVPEVTMLGVTGLSKKDALAAIGRLMEDGK